MLSPQEYQHYQRHITLPQLGLVGQTKLKNAKVLVIGAGGLSCPMLLYLAAAGVGKIGIMDGDTIDISNLHRQILYDIESVGKLKVAEAQRKLLLLNPHITIETYPFFCKAENALPIFAEYDVIADGSDNFATRYLTNDAAVLPRPEMRFPPATSDRKTEAHAARHSPLREIPGRKLCY